MSKKELEWKINTPAVLKEALLNEGASILRVPFKILLSILAEVAQRAIELDDPEMNALMCRLALYEESDPYNTETYNEELTRKTIAKGLKIKKKKHESR